MFCYAQINEEGICQVIGESTEVIEHPFCIPIEVYDDKYLNKKYDMAQKKWIDEYKELGAKSHLINGLSIDEKLNSIMTHLGLI